MPVFNGEKYLKEAIDSILSQTYKEFDLYIINDGSSDRSEQIILNYIDPRIKYVKNEVNLKLTPTLNRALDMIEHEYIVRMDADDIALPDRIKLQVEYMDKNPEVVVCGGQVKYFGQIERESSFPLEHDTIKAHLVFESSLAHPAVIIRNGMLKKNSIYYDPQHLHLEDYELWTRLSKLGKMANLPVVVLRYRLEGQNISLGNFATKKERIEPIYKKNLEELGIEPSPQNLLLHSELAGHAEELHAPKVLREYIADLLHANEKTGVYPQAAFEKLMKKKWEKAFFKYSDRSFVAGLKYIYASRKTSLKQLRYLFRSLVSAGTSQKNK